jgi:hypothetical protein
MTTIANRTAQIVAILPDLFVVVLIQKLIDEVVD